MQVKTQMGQRRWPFEHHVVWEAIYGPLPDGWVIHHLDEDKSNNDPANLKAEPDNVEHMKHHREANAERGRRMGLSGRGRPKSPEHRARIAAALTGKAKSPEHRAAIGEASRRAWADGRMPHARREHTDSCGTCGQRYDRVDSPGRRRCSSCMSAAGKRGMDARWS